MKTSDSTQTEALIVGAGPVGLTLANDLAIRGVPFRIIDQLPQATPNSRAHGLQSRTLEVLDKLDLAQPILDASQHPQPPFLILSGNRTIVRLDLAGFCHKPYPYQLIIWQQNIERVLENALEQCGHVVERSARLVRFEMDADGVNAEIDRENGNHDVIHSSWIVGCDGRHSTVRENLGLKMQGTTMPGCFWLGEFDVDWKRSRDTLYEWWHKDGMAAAVYIDFTQKWHVFVEFRDSRDEEPDLARMNTLFRQRTGQYDAQLRNPAWMNTLKVNQRLPDHFIVGRAILAGDAAHVHSAAGGQGMNTGMQDALNLGWKLALTVSDEAAPILLQTYESERWPNARSVLRAAQTFHHIEIPHGAVGRWLGGTIFKVMQSVPSFGNAALARVGMLNINYERSPLSQQFSKDATRHARSGWYVLDVGCRLGNQPVALFDIIRGPQATLLLFAGVSPTNETVEAIRAIERTFAALDRHLRVHLIFGSEADADAAASNGAQTIIDGAQHLQVTLGMKDPEMIYIRPDGYIGLRTHDISIAAVRDYLKLIYAEKVLSG